MTRGWGLVPLHTCTSLACEQWPLKGTSKANIGDAFVCDAASWKTSKDSSTRDKPLLSRPALIPSNWTRRGKKKKKEQTWQDTERNCKHFAFWLLLSARTPSRSLRKGRFLFREQPLGSTRQCLFQRSGHRSEHEQKNGHSSKANASSHSKAKKTKQTNKTKHMTVNPNLLELSLMQIWRAR